MNDPIVGYADLAQITGLSIDALKARASRHTLPFSIHRTGRTVTFDRDEVMRWLGTRT